MHCSVHCHTALDSQSIARLARACFNGFARALSWKTRTGEDVSGPREATRTSANHVSPRNAERPLAACKWPPGLRAPGKSLARPPGPVADRFRDQSCVSAPPPILPTPFFCPLRMNPA
eukprot:15478743-Alexandrium_andersonii.AAC.1